MHPRPAYAMLACAPIGAEYPLQSCLPWFSPDALAARDARFATQKVRHHRQIFAPAQAWQGYPAEANADKALASLQRFRSNVLGGCVDRAAMLRGTTLRRCGITAWQRGAGQLRGPEAHETQKDPLLLLLHLRLDRASRKGLCITTGGYLSLLLH